MEVTFIYFTKEFELTVTQLTQTVNMKLGKRFTSILVTQWSGHFFVASATAQWWNVGGNNNDNDVAKVDTTTTLAITDTTDVVTGTRTSTTFTTSTSGMDTTKKE